MLWLLVVICIVIIVYQDDLAFSAVQAWDRFSHAFNNFNPVSPRFEEILVLAGSCAFFLARTKELRKNSLMHLNNRNLILSASIGIALGLLLNMDE